MSRTLTASDRTNLIRLASSLEKGSPERKAILAGLAYTKRSDDDTVSASDVADAIFAVSENAQRSKALLGEGDLVDMASRGFRHRVDVGEIEEVIEEAIEALIKSGDLKKTPRGYMIV